MSLPPASDPVVHSYDTERHAIRCGAAGQINSTKHTKSVTCPECLQLLADVLLVTDVRN